ncbi:MAG: hypothetical protein A2359_01665 [Candidatus Moranbacteria bacterium RIFOXYB1_FULL_43_19]|nr:MAG: hypothetical protein A2359_01665 [Candidatus Moranbacteria bacterium RIFOXYB1_FULL_43_19]OGI32630.1 MAG: hypothetical protein A2420_01315 [Candidatus Moranbacteria bacterium RIFOXYC1_FULL_44_13]OGI37864.1 MAG: hypothetical protein A2612_05535 [Candidatus Moranbacteria bacterium RIFOXYD1_FULL_44_12]
MLKCSVGVMAHNEEKNIARLLEALLGQELLGVEISEIIVVASGCTDRTKKIACEVAEKNPKIKVLVQEKREGKASAVNLWLKKAAADIMVMESADTIPEKDTIEKIVIPFENPEIGMAGARPVPTNDPKTFMGFATHLLWNLHHHISLKNPKMGELVAFRKVISEIPVDTAVDEAEIEAAVKKNGYGIKYVPDAVVQNRGPENISDFLKQRRRIQAGHLALKKKGHSVSTSNGGKIFLLLLRNMDWDLRSLVFTPLVVLLEAWGRFLGWYDWRIKRKKHHIWEIAKSTKKL